MEREEEKFLKPSKLTIAAGLRSEGDLKPEFRRGCGNAASKPERRAPSVSR